MLTAHSTGDRTHLMRVGRCLVVVDFAREVYEIHAPDGTVLPIGEHDGIDWRAVLLREKEYRRGSAGQRDTADFLRAVDACLYAQDVIGADESINLGYLDDGRAG